MSTAAAANIAPTDLNVNATNANTNVHDPAHTAQINENTTAGLSHSDGINHTTGAHTENGIHNATGAHTDATANHTHPTGTHTGTKAAAATAAVASKTGGTHDHTTFSKYQDTERVRELETDIAAKKKAIETGPVNHTFLCFGNADKSKLAKLEKALQIELAKPLPQTAEQKATIHAHDHHEHGHTASDAHTTGIIAPHGAVDPTLAEGGGVTAFPDHLVTPKVNAA